jgi:hypothetical protein
MKQLDMILDTLGTILGVLAYISPKFRKNQKQAKAIQSSVQMAQGLIEDLQRAQRANSDGGEAVTFQELEAISHRAISGVQDLVKAIEGDNV